MYNLVQNVLCQALVISGANKSEFHCAKHNFADPFCCFCEKINFLSSADLSKAYFSINI